MQLLEKNYIAKIHFCSLGNSLSPNKKLIVIKDLFYLSLLDLVLVNNTNDMIALEKT